MEPSPRPTLAAPLAEPTHGSTPVQNQTSSPHSLIPFAPHVGDHTKLNARHKHKPRKSRNETFARKMNSTFHTSSGARGSLSTFQERGNDDDGLLRPITRETTRSRWGSESTARGTASRSGSLFDDIDKGKQPSLIKPREIRSMEDLQLVRDQRTQVEEFLRSTLSMIGTLATDITRRLDYTYYGLLEKLATLNSTIISFQDLLDSTSKLFSDVQRETSGLEQEIRKQIGDLKEFQPQMQKVEALEKRMRAGKTRAKTLSNRLEAMRNEVERWEKKEVESQNRINQRLRIFWGVVTASICAIMVAAVIQSWPMMRPISEAPLQALLAPTSSVWAHTERHSINKDQKEKNAWRSPTNSQLVVSTDTPTSNIMGTTARSNNYDPLRIFDEL